MATKPAKASKPAPKKPKLLSGGNPQIPKGFGDAPVKAFIAAVPGWQKDIAALIDTMIEKTVPGVVKAVKWNTPLYGLQEGYWFLGMHVFAKYVRITFFQGKSMRPVPPGASKIKNVRYLDIREGEFDEAQFIAWVKQASKLPGERM